MNEEDKLEQNFFGSITKIIELYHKLEPSDKESLNLFS